MKFLGSILKREALPFSWLFLLLSGMHMQWLSRMSHLRSWGRSWVWRLHDWRTPDPWEPQHDFSESYVYVKEKTPIIFKLLRSFLGYTRTLQINSSSSEFEQINWTIIYECKNMTKYSNVMMVLTYLKKWVYTPTWSLLH